MRFKMSEDVCILLSGIYPIIKINASKGHCIYCEYDSEVAESLDMKCAIALMATEGIHTEIYYIEDFEGGYYLIKIRWERPAEEIIDFIDKWTKKYRR